MMFKRILLLLCALLVSVPKVEAINFRKIVLEDLSIGSGTYTSPSGAVTGKTKINAGSFTFKTPAVNTKTVNDWVDGGYDTDIKPARVIPNAAEVGILVYDANGDEVISNTELATAISAISSTQVTLIIDVIVTPSTAHIFPATTSLNFISPGKFVKGGSGAITVDGPMFAAPYMIFSGFAAGDIVLGNNVQWNYGEWYGADNTGATDSSGAMQIAIDASNRIDLLAEGTYAFGELELKDRFQFNGNYAMVKAWGTPTDMLLMDSDNSGADDQMNFITIRDMRVVGSVNMTNFIRFNGGNFHYCAVENIEVLNPAVTGTGWTGSMDSIIKWTNETSTFAPSQNRIENISGRVAGINHAIRLTTVGTATAQDRLDVRNVNHWSPANKAVFLMEKVSLVECHNISDIFGVRHAAIELYWARRCDFYNISMEVTGTTTENIIIRGPMWSCTAHNLRITTDTDTTPDIGFFQGHAIDTRFTELTVGDTDGNLVDGSITPDLIVFEVDTVSGNANPSHDNYVGRIKEAGSEANWGYRFGSLITEDAGAYRNVYERNKGWDGIILHTTTQQTLTSTDVGTVTLVTTIPGRTFQPGDSAQIEILGHYVGTTNHKFTVSATLSDETTFVNFDDATTSHFRAIGDLVFYNDSGTDKARAHGIGWTAGALENTVFTDTRTKNLDLSIPINITPETLPAGDLIILDKVKVTGAFAHTIQ